MPRRSKAFLKSSKNLRLLFSSYSHLCVGCLFLPLHPSKHPHTSHTHTSHLSVLWLVALLVRVVAGRSCDLQSRCAVAALWERRCYCDLQSRCGVRVTSRHVMSCHLVSRRVAPCCVLSRRVVSYRAREESGRSISNERTAQIHAARLCTTHTDANSQLYHLPSHHSPSHHSCHAFV